MRSAVKDYCEEENLTVFELFCKAYAHYIGKPLGLTQFCNVNRSAQMFLAAKNDTVPTYVADFIEKERRRQMELFAQ